jgi:hypothetical protein
MPPGLSCLKMCPNRVPVAHACNPSYSGERDQEDRSSKLAQNGRWECLLSDMSQWWSE